MSEFPRLSEKIPSGQSGDVVIEHIDHLGERLVKLSIDGLCWMSDAPDERELNRVVVEKARGDVLICGLGLGMILEPILAKESVRSVTVLEVSSDVLALVAPCYSLPKLKIVHADCWDFQTENCFDTIWQDVIYDPPNQMPEVERLESKLRLFLKPGGWLGSWKCNG